MPTNHSLPNKRREPSLWTCVPANDSVSQLGNTHRADELADASRSLLEANAQLRKLAVQLSNLLGDLPVTTTGDIVSGGPDDVVVNRAGAGL